MKLLLIYPYVPYPLNRGSYHRVFNLARELGKRHELDLFCLDDSSSECHRAVFEDFTKRICFHPFRNAPWPSLFPSRILNSTPATIRHWSQPSVAEAIQTFTSGRHYDIVHFCDLVLWQYVAPMPTGPLLVMDRSRVDLLFQTEEIQNLKLRLKDKFLRRENIWKLKRYENEAAAKVDATVVCGPDDETFLRKEVPTARQIKVTRQRGR